MATPDYNVHLGATLEYVAPGQVTEKRFAEVVASCNRREFSDLKTVLHGPADFDVTCGDLKFRVHEGVLSERSPHFARACYNGFKETMQKSLDLSDLKPEEIACLINFCYVSRFTSECSLAMHAQQPGIKEWRRLKTIFYARMYAIADLYEVDSLKLYTLDYFKTVGAEYVEQNLGAVAQAFLERMPRPDNCLRDILFKPLLEKHVSNPDWFVDNEEALKIFDDCPDFPRYLCKLLAGMVKEVQKREQKKWAWIEALLARCSSCHRRCGKRPNMRAAYWDDQAGKPFLFCHGFRQLDSIKLSVQTSVCKPDPIRQPDLKYSTNFGYNWPSRVKRSRLGDLIPLRRE